jgi:hypothetical protein
MQASSCQLLFAVTAVQTFNFTACIEWLLYFYSVAVLTCVRAEQLVLNHCCQWQAVKQVCQHLPDACAAVLPQALLVEAIHLTPSEAATQRQGVTDSWHSHTKEWGSLRQLCTKELQPSLLP